MKTLFSLLLLGWALAGGPGSSLGAATSFFPLEDRGDTTYDPNTGLEWLDLSRTAGQSYSNVLSGWNSYTTSQGYRFATRDEVVQLFIDVGAAYIGTPSFSGESANLPAATQALSLLGTTLAQTDLQRSWMFYAPGTEPTLPSPPYVPAAVFGAGVVYAGSSEQGFFLVPGLFPLQTYASSELASALVRAVPEPSTTALVWACLLVLVGVKQAPGQEPQGGCGLHRHVPDPAQHRGVRSCGGSHREQRG